MPRREIAQVTGDAWGTAFGYAMSPAQRHPAREPVGTEKQSLLFRMSCVQLLEENSSFFSTKALFTIKGFGS